MMILDSLPSRLLISVVLLILIAVYHAAMIAINEANEARIKKIIDNDANNKRASRVMWLIKHHNELSRTSYFATVLLISAITVIVCTKLHFYIADHAVLSVILSIIIADAAILTFGIYTPNKFAKKNADNTALFLSGIAKPSVIILRPFVFFFTLFSKLLLKLLKINPDSDDNEVTEEEILMMVNMGSTSGAIDPDEKEMINNIFEFDDTPAKDIMTHRTDVEFLWIEDDIDTWDKTILESNHSIYPVCGENVDDIVGILASKDFYRMLRTSENPDVKTILKTPFFIPESIKADELFKQMQKNKTHFAVVLDEYGGLGGIITISDLLEEIVGTLASGETQEAEDIVKLDSNTWVISGSADIDTVAEALNIDLPIEEYNTFAGMILGELGTIPEDGSTPEIEAYGLSIKVTKIEDHRIESAKVSVIDPVAADSKT